MRLRKWSMVSPRPLVHRFDCAAARVPGRGPAGQYRDTQAMYRQNIGSLTRVGGAGAVLGESFRSDGEYARAQRARWTCRACSIDCMPARVRIVLTGVT
jgi:hypothetical protein